MTMTLIALLLLSFFSQLGSAGFDPLYDYDAATTKYCTWWYDNWQGTTCSAVLVSKLNLYYPFK